MALGDLGPLEDCGRSDSLIQTEVDLHLHGPTFREGKGRPQTMGDPLAFPTH